MNFRNLEIAFWPSSSGNRSRFFFCHCVAVVAVMMFMLLLNFIIFILLFYQRNATIFPLRWFHNVDNCSMLSTLVRLRCNRWLFKQYTSAMCTQANSAHKSTPNPWEQRKHLYCSTWMHSVHADKKGSLWDALTVKCIFNCKMIMNYWNDDNDNDDDDRQRSVVAMHGLVILLSVSDYIYLNTQRMHFEHWTLHCM